MPIHSRWNLSIPNISLPQFLFTSPTAPLEHSQKPAYISVENPSIYLTQNSLRLYAQRFAAGLVRAGLQPGDRILLFSGNNIWFPVVFLGIQMAGGVFTGANPGYVAREFAYQLKDSEARFLICADASLELGIEAAESVGMGKERVFAFDDLLMSGGGKDRLGVRNWKILVESEKAGKDFKWVNPKDPKNDVCCLNYSSGTTGVPKGVMITHYNYIANAIQYNHMPTLSADYEERTKTAAWLCFLPMYHAMAQALFITCGPKRGIPVYLMKKFDFVQMLDAVQEFKISNLIMVPPIVVALAKSPITKNYDLSSVIDLGSGAAPLGGDVIREAEALWPEGDRKLKQGWGMTEATCSILGWDPRLEPHPSSVGELNANCSAKIVSTDSEDFQEVPVGSRGEIWVQGPNIMKGYWRNERATSEIFVDGPDGRWMRTGDIAYVDDQGRFFVVDRMKELIKVKGNQVAPAELEGLLLEHPELDDACVVGVTVNGEEMPRAYVVRRQGGEVSEEGVAQWMSEKVSRTKRLTGGVVFVDAVPKNPSGKILRKVLRERAKDEVGDKEIKARL
ncbi:related to 4-coumarate--CoA ligase [Rhynchosporium secalis]|uniref:Related to 4-coumarate--CoA ligase n=1 Tax=Rhynchosporium secalis TaxID=38038 RepID=A0A1E1M5E2_RHYSE|nr:related to 4-coumarate--CoA ligase [Rhynchosporium secalis]